MERLGEIETRESSFSFFGGGGEGRYSFNKKGARVHLFCRGGLPPLPKKENDSSEVR